MKYQSFDPYHLRLLEEFATENSDAAQRKITALNEGYSAWNSNDVSAKKEILKNIGAALLSNKQELAASITTEMGKLYAESIAEIEKCAAACAYYSENFETFIPDQQLPNNARITYKPLGIIYGVFPWNFPFWQVFRAFVPMLCGGNVLLMKHAQNVPRCALLLRDLVNKTAGTVLIENIFADIECSDAIIAHPEIKAVTFTGSTNAGAYIASKAAQSLKKSVLELGGSDPFIVTSSASLDIAVKTAAKSRYQNNGQSCVAAKRFIIHDSLYEEFKTKFIAKISGLKTGDPMDTSTQLSCLARPDLKTKLLEQIEKSVSMGCTLAYGGQNINETQMQATVLEHIVKGSPAYSEELFGPAASLFRYKTKEEAVQLANDTAFGLGATVFTDDENEKHYFSENLESGMLYFNMLLKSTPEWPFGGIKNSGWGRELTAHGVMEFVNKKLIAG